MKRYKRLYVLLGILVVVFAATIGVLNYEKKQEDIKTSGEVILTIAKEEVKGLSWESEEDSFAFKKEDKWIYEADEAFPVDGEEIESLLEAVEEWKATFIIENVDDFGQYGLDDPEGKISVKTESEEYEISLGEFSTMDNERYISIGDGNVYLVAEDPMDSFTVKLTELMKHDEIPSFEEVNAVEFSGAYNYSVKKAEKSSTYDEEDLYETTIEGETLQLDPDNVDNYLYSMEILTLNDYKTYKASSEELTSYGLDEPELTVTVAYKGEDEKEETFTLSLGRNPEDAKDGDEEEIVAYVKVGESDIIYEITSSEYKELSAASYDDLRHQEVFWADFEEISKIKAVLDGEEYLLTKKGKGDDRVYEYEGREVKTEELDTSLEVLLAESFTKKEPEGKEEISLTITLENETQKEVSLAFYRHDGSSCLAVVDDQPVCLVERSHVVDLIEAVNQIVLD